jgi:UDP-glucuronate decarboxylase
VAFDDYREIWNLACPASPPRYQSDPIGTMMTNVVGMHNVLSLAAKCGAVVLQASTSEVYGDPDIHPQPESYRGAVSTIGPRACYDEGKRAAEALCFDYARKEGVRIKVARIFNTYGPRMDPDDGRVVSNFIVKALQGRPLTIYGDGAQTRSFCYRDDLIEGLFRLMASAPEITGPVNIGNPGEFTVLQLAEIVREVTGRDVALEYLPRPIDDPRQRRPDISLATQLLAWSPRVALVDGIRRTVEHFREELHRADPAAGGVAR